MYAIGIRVDCHMHGYAHTHVDTHTHTSMQAHKRTHARTHAHTHRHLDETDSFLWTAIYVGKGGTNSFHLSKFLGSFF